MSDGDAKSGEGAGDAAPSPPGARLTGPGGVDAAKLLAPARRTIGGFPAARLPDTLSPELEDDAGEELASVATRISEPPQPRDTGPPSGSLEATIASDEDLPMPIPDVTPPDFQAPRGAPSAAVVRESGRTDPTGIPNAAELLRRPNANPPPAPPRPLPPRPPAPGSRAPNAPPPSESPAASPAAPAPAHPRTAPPSSEFDAVLEEDDEDDNPFLSLSKGSNLGGRYRLERILGKGATGVVFEASHLVIGKRVAVKCLFPHHRATPVAVERFFQEARIAATVEHPNVIQIFDGGDEKDTLFLAMELLEGTSLADRIDNDGPMALGEAVRIFLGIMSGVAAVHEAGVVHRDLKPDNIFLQKTRFSEREEPKVLDFGISKLKQPGKELTSLGVVMGTPTYMAPEQVASTRDVDVRADVYSLGVMLYEALAGDVPYSADTVLDIFRAAEAGGATPLCELRGDVSRELSDVIAKAMTANIKERYESVAEFAAAIRALPFEITDPEKPSPPIPDIRATVRDLPAAIRDRETHIRGEVIEPPHTRSASMPNVAAREDERSTVALAQPMIIERTPRWVYAALGGASVLTFTAILIALIAVLR